MKKFFLFITILTILCLCYIIFSVYNQRLYSSESFPPCLNNGKKWKIGYFESGKSMKYSSSLKNYINYLAKTGWADAIDWKKLPADSTSKEIWNFLAQNMRSEYIQIDKKYFWSSDWSLSKREKIRKQLIYALQRKNVDLMLTMGAWGGQDLANNQHSVPIICLESSLNIKKLLRRNGEIPENLYFPRNPNFLLRQIRLFRKITKFKTLGVVYVASSEGRFRANLKLLKKLSKEKNFELIAVRILPHKELNSTERLKNYIQAHEQIVKKIDAMWLTSDFMDNPESASKLLTPFFKYKIPTWYPYGKRGVANGAVFGVIHNPLKRAQHYAAITAKIFNGVKPASQIKILPIDNHLIINCAAAKKINFKITKSLLSVAEKTYLEINTGEKK
jgi:ABC-type uncharacterized transport system substrate-binding protein